MKRIFFACLFFLSVSSMYAVEKESTALYLLYQTKPGFLMRKILCSPWLSSLTGWLADRRISRYFISTFVKLYNIDPSEAKKTLEQYETFNDFFTRELKEGARAINDEENGIISPADGTILAVVLKQNATFPIKETTFNLERFLNDTALAQAYKNGTMFIIRLAPHDYHRFHFPCGGTPEKFSRIGGRYESVNPLVYKMGIQPLIENERHLIKFKSTCADEVLIVPVGALCVGRIVETFEPATLYKKGQQAGYFCFGGSTIVLLFKENTVDIEKEILHASQQGQEYPIKLGQKIAQCAEFTAV